MDSLIKTMSCGCANHALEVLGKSISEDGPDIWAEHESPFIRRIVELFTQRGLARTAKIQEELAAWLSGKRSTHAAQVQRPGFAPAWTADDLGLVKIYLEALPENAWQLEDYDYLIQYLVQRYMPAGAIMSDAEWLAVRSNFMGKAQVYFGGDFSAAHADALIAALPLTVYDAVKTFTPSMAARQVLEYGRLRAAENVVALADSARHALKATVIEHMSRAMQGDPAATPAVLKQKLFDNFSAMNRDWRRIALTEAGEMANQGMIAALDPGTQVKRLEEYKGACGFCKKIDGRVFNVVSPDDPDKNGETDVWPGKTNVGRSASPRKKTENGLELREPEEMWWPAAGVQHPHCRGIWTKVEKLSEGVDPKFEAFIRRTFGVKEGVRLDEWSSRHRT